MARSFFEVEKGLRVVGVNSTSGFNIFYGTGAPAGTSGDTYSAEMGSIYVSDAGSIYIKKYNNGNAEDWITLSTNEDVLNLKWRSEKVTATTVEVLSAGTRNLSTPLTGDQSPYLTASDFSVDDYIIGGSNTATPKLLKVTNISGTTLTLVEAANPIADGNVFISNNYLPDSPADQEKQAIIVFQSGTGFVKISDFNWNVADGIELSAGYSSENGSISSSDSVNSAIQKLDGNQQDIQTTIGVAQGDTDLGSFDGSTISDNRTVKEALQDLETAHEDHVARVNALGVENYEVSSSGGVVTVDSVDALACKWLIHVTSESKSVAVEVWGATDGTDVNASVYAFLRIGENNTLNPDFGVNFEGGELKLIVETTSSALIRVKRLAVLDIP